MKFSQTFRILKSQFNSAGGERGQGLPHFLTITRSCPLCTVRWLRSSVDGAIFHTISIALFSHLFSRWLMMNHDESHQSVLHGEVFRGDGDWWCRTGVTEHWALVYTVPRSAYSQTNCLPSSIKHGLLFDSEKHRENKFDVQLICKHKNPPEKQLYFFGSPFRGATAFWLVWSLDSPLVRHLLTVWRSAWQPCLFDPRTCRSCFIFPLLTFEAILQLLLMVRTWEH